MSSSPRSDGWVHCRLCVRSWGEYIASGLVKIAKKQVDWQPVVCKTTATTTPMFADSKEGHDLKISSKSLEDVVGGSSVVHRDPFHIYNEVLQTMDELFCCRAPLGLHRYGVSSTN